MRESIGGTWTMQIVIVFILFFVAFITLTINYTRAFKVKNEIISIIEREDGFTYSALDSSISDPAGARELIASYLTNNGYSAKGKCDLNWTGVTSIDINKANEDSTYQLVDNDHKNDKYYYCIQKIQVPVQGKKHKELYNYNNRAYYRVRLFFKFSIPVLGDLTTFKVEGESLEVYFNGDGLKLFAADTDGGVIEKTVDIIQESTDKTPPTVPTVFKLTNPVIKEGSATFTINVGGSTDDDSGKITYQFNDEGSKIIYQVKINGTWQDCTGNAYYGTLANKDANYTITARACDSAGNCSNETSRNIQMNARRLYIWQVYQYMRADSGDVVIGQPSENEINDNLRSGKMAENVYNMYNSPEATKYFDEKGIPQTVTNLYKGILGRNYDEDGYNSNVSTYQSYGKDNILKVFVNSEEAQKLYAYWGLGTGAV